MILLQISECLGTCVFSVTNCVMPKRAFVQLLHGQMKLDLSISSERVGYIDFFSETIYYIVVLCLFTFEVTFTCLFAPSSQSRISKNFEIQNPWGKLM